MAPPTQTLVLTQQIDSTTWQALGMVLTLVGLMLSILVWRHAGAGRGLRAVGWSLVPLAAGLTGVLRLGWEVLDSVLRWATRLVFSPVVWLGLVVAGVALTLHVTGTFLIRRSSRTDPAASDGGRAALEAGGAASPSAPAAKQSKKPRKAKNASSEQMIEDQDDIEAILRKHGIS